MSPSIGGWEAARVAGVTYRKVEYWIRSGLLVPSGGNVRPGSGHHRRLSPEDVDALRVLDQIMAVRSGTDVLDTIARIVRHVQASGAVGIFELIPGITVDLERLVGGGIAEPELPIDEQAVAS